MRKLLNTLYVTIPNAYLSKDGETVLVRVEQETRLRVPIHTLEGIVCVGVVSMSPPLMGFCAERNVCVSFLSEHGRFLARIQGPIHGNVLLRREQYRRADGDAESASIAKSILWQRSLTAGLRSCVLAVNTLQRPLILPLRNLANRCACSPLHLLSMDCAESKEMLRNRISASSTNSSCIRKKISSFARAAAAHRWTMLTLCFHSSMYFWRTTLLRHWRL